MLSELISSGFSGISEKTLACTVTFCTPIGMCYLLCCCPDISQALTDLRYRTCAGYQIAIIPTAPPPVTEITRNHKDYDVSCQANFCLNNLKCAS